MHRKKSKRRERGVISVYMALTVVIIMSASAVMFSDIVSRQLRLSTDVEFTERAFYSASSGMEHVFHLISSAEEEEMVVTGAIQYDGDEASYEVKVGFDVDGREEPEYYYDVNGDGYVTVEDIVLVENCLNGHCASLDRTGSPWQNQDNPFDVSNNQSVTPIDVLLITNLLNRYMEDNGIPEEERDDERGNVRIKVPSPPRAALCIASTGLFRDAVRRLSLNESENCL